MPKKPTKRNGPTPVEAIKHKDSRVNAAAESARAGRQCATWAAIIAWRRHVANFIATKKPAGPETNSSTLAAATRIRAEALIRDAGAGSVESMRRWQP